MLTFVGLVYLRSYLVTELSEIIQIRDSLASLTKLVVDTRLSFSSVVNGLAYFFFYSEVNSEFNLCAF